MKYPQWRIQDFLKGVSVTLLRAKCAQNFGSHTHFWVNPCPFRLFWAKLPAQSICFRQLESSLWLTHAKVSHSSGFLRSVARAGGSISWKSKPLHNVLVFHASTKGGFHGNYGNLSGSTTVPSELVMVKLDHDPWHTHCPLYITWLPMYKNYTW